MGRTSTNAAAVRQMAQSVRSSGKAVTSVGQEHVREHGRVNTFVDPKSRSAQREARNILVEQPNGTWLLPRGVVMPVLTCFDGTGSMSDNIDKVFFGRAEFRELLEGDRSPILGRYQVQSASSRVSDRNDGIPLCFSEFESGIEAEEQFQHLVSGGGQGNGAEYQLQLYFAGSRVECDLWRYGIKGHLHVIGDELGHDLHADDVRSILGIELETEMSAIEVAEMAAKKWQMVYFHVDGDGGQRAVNWWNKLIGADRVIKIRTADNLIYWQAVTIGLIEGELSLGDVKGYLTEVAGLKDSHAIKQIAEGVQGLPVGAQRELPGFDRIPMKGSVFAKQDDLWPIDAGAAEAASAGVQTAKWQL